MNDQRTVDVIRRLADEQAPAPPSAEELDALLTGLPSVPARRRRFTGWSVAAAALVAVATFTWFGSSELPPDSPGAGGGAPPPPPPMKT